MATITTRSSKGSALTHNELDANFTNLNTDKAEIASPTFTGAPLSTTPNVDDNTTKIATTAFVDTSFAKKAGDTLTSSTLTSATLTDATLNTSITGTAVLDDNTMDTASATTLATSESIKAYVDDEVAKVTQYSNRIAMYTTAPTVAYSTFSKNVATDFGVPTGSLVDVLLEWECLNDTRGFSAGDILSYNSSLSQHDDAYQHPLWHTSSDCSTADIKITLGNYVTSGAFHLWNDANAVGADGWAAWSDWKLYARVIYLP